eukprot:PhF_6_TR9230/c0_g1_i1/m.14530/K04955/HCN2; hyperpolarization activated cyclic nucleotide-gated potassium channel 2
MGHGDELLMRLVRNAADDGVKDTDAFAAWLTFNSSAILQEYVEENTSMIHALLREKPKRDLFAPEVSSSRSTTELTEHNLHTSAKEKDKRASVLVQENAFTLVDHDTYSEAGTEATSTMIISPRQQPLSASVRSDASHHASSPAGGRHAQQQPPQPKPPRRSFSKGDGEDDDTELYEIPKDPNRYLTAIQVNENKNMELHKRSVKYASVVLFLFLIFNIIVVPMRVAFRTQNLILSDTLLDAEIPVDIFTVCTLLVLGLGAYEEGGHLIIDRNLRGKRYIKNYLLFDLIGMLPLQIIDLSLRYNRIVLLYRLPGVMTRSYKILFHGVLHPAFLDILPLLSYVFFTWYAWSMGILAMIDADWHATEDWIHRHNWTSYDNEFHAWVESASISLLLLFGYHVHYPKSDLQVGVLLIGSIIGTVISVTILAIAGHVVHAHADTKEQLLQKLDTVTDEMYRLDLPDEFVEEVQTYYRRVWAICRTFDDHYGENIFDDLPEPLQKQLEYEAHVSLVSSIPMFAKAVSNRAFVRRLVKALSVEWAVPGATIFSRGDVGDTMFFLHKGEARVEGSAVTFTSGSYFGESSLLFGGVRPATVEASTMCHLYVLRKVDFDSLIDRFPDTLEPLLEGVKANLRSLGSNRRRKSLSTKDLREMYHLARKTSQIVSSSLGNSMLAQPVSPLVLGLALHQAGGGGAENDIRFPVDDFVTAMDNVMSQSANAGAPSTVGEVATESILARHGSMMVHATRPISAGQRHPNKVVIHHGGAKDHHHGHHHPAHPPNRSAGRNNSRSDANSELTGHSMDSEDDIMHLADV